MSKEAIKDVAASVRQRLLNISKEQEEDFNLVLTRYGLERMLYRLSQSKWNDEFLLKGAMLFMLWHDNPHRPTRDADLLGFVEPELEKIKTIFQSLCYIVVEDDGLRFDPESVRVDEIRENNAYEGIRVRLAGELSSTKVTIQIDIGFGDVVTPDPEEIEYPTLLNQAAPKLKAYPVYTVIAEKFEAMVKLGMINTRMKDFYDLWVLINKFELNNELLKEAIKATFTRRKTEIPTETPIVFTEEFYSDDSKQKQWSAFLNKNGIEDGGDLDKVVIELKEFLMPLIKRDNTAYKK